MFIQHVVIGIIRKNNKYLLTKRVYFDDEKDNQFYPFVWNFPGGGIEANETPQQALIRELKEELNVEVDKITSINKMFTDTRGNWQGIFYVFLCQLKNKDQLIILNEEASEYGWFETQEIKNLKTLPLTYEMAEIADKITI